MVESKSNSRIKKAIILVIPFILLAAAFSDPVLPNWKDEPENITKIDVLNGLSYDEVNADQQMIYHLLKQIEERSGWINTTTHVKTDYVVNITGNMTANIGEFNNLTVLENVRILKTLYGGSPLQIGDDVRFVNESLDTLFSIYTANTAKNFSNVPAGFNSSLIFETSRINNDYRMEVCFWDNQTQKMILCLNEGEPLRATTVRRSLQVVGNTSTKENDENFTLCEGANYVDCSTDVTGADLYVQDDIEAQSIYANENIFAEERIDSESGLGVPKINAINISCDKINTDLLLTYDIHTSDITTDLISTDEFRMVASNGCLILRDTDNNGWTKCTALNGVLTCVIDADGLC